MGRMWAERRTTISKRGEEGGLIQEDGRIQEGGHVEAVALWVHLDPESWRPAPLSDREVEVYEPASDGRRVVARLRHPPPASRDAAGVWTFRATELDVANHINNTAYWEPLEQELLQGPEPGCVDVEIEFRTPAQPGEKRILSDGNLRWIVDPEGEVHASALIAER
jgi:acyl-ACP thioesterase